MNYSVFEFEKLGHEFTINIIKVKSGVPHLVHFNNCKLKKIGIAWLHLHVFLLKNEFFLLNVS
jgi:hypothetical protein